MDKWSNDYYGTTIHGLKDDSVKSPDLLGPVKTKEQLMFDTIKRTRPGTTEYRNARSRYINYLRGINNLG